MLHLILIRRINSQGIAISIEWHKTKPSLDTSCLGLWPVSAAHGGCPGEVGAGGADLRRLGKVMGGRQGGRRGKNFSVASWRGASWRGVAEGGGVHG